MVYLGLGNTKFAIKLHLFFCLGTVVSRGSHFRWVGSEDGVWDQNYRYIDLCELILIAPKMHQFYHFCWLCWFSMQIKYLNSILYIFSSTNLTTYWHSHLSSFSCFCLVDTFFDITMWKDIFLHISFLVETAKPHLHARIWQCRHKMCFPLNILLWHFSD